jgi:hypothetical protein
VGRHRRDSGRRVGYVAETDDLDDEAATSESDDDAVKSRVRDVVPAGDDGDVDVQTSSIVDRVRLTPRKSV